jgi:TPR repeat protein
MQARMTSVLLMSVALLFGPAAVQAQTRVALLIGEGDYFHPPPTVHGVFWPKLANPPHDVSLVAQKLKEDGFDTTLAVDFNRAALEKAIAAFAIKAAKADDAVVYYAGHGFEYARHNYLVPIDAPTQVDVNHLGQTYIDLDEVAQAAGRARHVNVFFMDACRTSDSFVKLTGPSKPYVDDIEFRPGTPVAVVYSTARGEEAYDHAMSAPPPLDYSPFAWFVAQYVTLPRTSLGDFFTFVNAKVQESTKKWGPQSPYMLSSLTEVYYFRPAGALTPRPPATTGSSSTAQAGRPQGRGLSGPLDLKLDYLAVTDEPVVVADVLADHSPDDLAALAQNGDPMAAYLLGYMFEFGRGAQQDLVQARTWLEQAATSGLAPAQLELGYFLEHHGAGNADSARARSLMEAAAGQGFAKAQAHLADVLMNDKVYADYYRGLDLYRAAAKQNYPQAVYALAVLRQPDARTNLAALAAGGDMSSRQWLCELAAGDGTIGPAFADCAAAARAGYAISEARLAMAYHDGAGVAADADEARHWTRLALEQPDLRDDLRGRLQAFGY